MLATDSLKDELQADCFLVRLGTMGHVGRFRLAADLSPTRSNRVICRTTRGIEMGTVLGPANVDSHGGMDLADGRILRRMTPEDELLWGHLCELGQAAHDSCVAWLHENQIAATLLDVEPLLDGKTLYFHFLSSVSDEVQTHLNELVNLYESAARSSQFARLVEHGCGPGCGTEKAVNGCGTSGGGCAVCKIASSCQQSKS